MSWTDEYRTLRPTGAKALGRGLALSLLAATQGRTRSWLRSLARPRVHVLLLHHVFADEERTFANFVERLAGFAKFEPYSAAVERIRRGPIDRPYVTFSFDDGLASCVRAARVLERFGARAMFFVNPAVVGLPPGDELAAWCRDRIRMPPTPVMNWGELEQLRAAGHEVGNHTMHHVDLGRPDRPLDEQVGASRDELVRRLGPEAGRHFAWTYGQFANITETARRAVRQAGHESIASGVRGAHVATCSDADALCIRRDLFVGGEPLAHGLYFHARTAARATAADNDWPTLPRG